MRQYFVIIPLLIIGLLNIFVGCERDIKGPPRVNIKPVVNFVNIPVENALFSSDTTIYWYGTDVDGFIDSFYYAVVRLSDVGSDPDAFLAGGGLPTDSMDMWSGIKVELDNTGTNAKVQMSADISDPVRTYVTSYIFLLAVDNKGARSDIVYRSFAKNNHFPNTTVNVNGFRDPYINAVSDDGILEGVTINFSAEDRIDYPRNPPPFEYRWKVFGPFDDSVKSLIDSVYITEVFVDLYGDFFQHGDTLRYFNRLDTNETTGEIDTIWHEFPVDEMLGGNPYGFWQDAILGIDPHMDSLTLDSIDHYKLADLTLLNGYVVDSSENPNWTFNTQVSVFDLFGKQDVSPEDDTTRIMSFMVWCQTRDDAHVPDPVPDFRFITVIEPKFERDVVILDAGIYSRSSVYNWPIFPLDPWEIPNPGEPFPDTSGPAIRDILGEFINDWKPGSFDADDILPDDTVCPDHTPVDCGSGHLWVTFNWRSGTTQDYYPIYAINSYVDSGYASISLREILKHKIALIVKDNTANPIGFESLEGLAVIDGINAGMNAWIMARAAAGEGFVSAGNRPDVGEILSSYFGIDSLQQTGWQERTASGNIRIEDFIGATSLIPSELPHLLIDTTRLESFYLWDSTRCDDPELPCYPFRDLVTGEIITGAMPEVGYLVRGFGTEPLYLYKSKYGNHPPYYIDQREGTVVAIRYDHPYFRTAHFNFNVMAMDEVSARQVFETMMEWLSYQPFINAGKVNANYFGNDVKKFRNISRRLHQLKKQGLLPSMGEL